MLPGPLARWFAAPSPAPAAGPGGRGTLRLTLVRVPAAEAARAAIADDDDGVGAEDRLAALWRELSARAGCATAAPETAGGRGDVDDGGGGGGGGGDGSGAEDTTAAAAERMERHIFAFLRRSDRYMALVSTLLKSRAYHAAASAPGAGAEPPRCPVVELPRTARGQPYLPHQWTADGVSVSHQCPVVGLAHWRRRGATAPAAEAASPPLPPPPPPVGLDVVVFDPYPRTLYASLVDFLEAFRDAFVDDEWETLVSMSAAGAAASDRGAIDKDDEALREFYLRWAVKEAYTKALGLGLGCNFASFQIGFDPELGEGRLWRTLVAAAGRRRARGAPSDEPDTVQLKGRIRRQQDGRLGGPESAATFYFVPLYGTGSVENRRDGAPAMQGCACVCIVSAESEPVPRLSIEWKSLDDLLTFHMPHE